MVDERDILAAEFALGLLHGAERIEAARLLHRDPDFARAVAEWQRRLSPLAEAMPEEQPPEALWRRIAAAIPETTATAKPANGMLAVLRRRIALWRLAAIASAAAAVVLTALLIGRFGLPGLSPAEAERYVAMLRDDSGAMGYVVTVEPTERRVLVRNMGVAPPPQKDFELWIMYRNGAEPLGRIRPDGSSTLPLPKSVQMAALTDQPKVVVCVEPLGGRPPGQTMGPVVYQGELVRQTP